MHNRILVGAASLVALLALSACSDSPVASPPQNTLEALPPAELAHLNSTTCQIGRIFVIASQLSPLSARHPYNLQAAMTVALVLTNNQLALAQKLVRGIAVVLSKDAVLVRLRDPNGAAPPTKTEAISELINLLFSCVALPPPGNVAAAYGEGGAVAVIGTGGGDVETNNGFAGLRVAPGTFQHDEFITFVPLPATEQCVPTAMIADVVDCYEIASTFIGTLPVAIRLVLCSFDPHENGEAEHKHDRLRIAKTQALGRMKVYDRLSDPLLLDCEGRDPRVASGIMGGLSRLASAITKPFRPTLAYAADGVGADIFEFSRATVVDEHVFDEGFESEGAWATTGFWHRSALVDSNRAFPTLVDLGDGDASLGKLPAPFAGSQALWYGNAGQGNYLGASTLFPAQNGGTSDAPNSGTASSPLITVPVLTNALTLSFQTWFEIESVNPTSFDSMSVVIENVTDESSAQIFLLNPNVDQGTSRVPETSTGFNTAPAWVEKSIDVSAYQGKQIRLHFRFNTRDELYNGFRGWIVDDVHIAISAEGVNAPPVGPFLRAKIVKAKVMGADGPRVYQP